MTKYLCVFFVVALLVLLNNQLSFFAFNISGPSDEESVRLMTYNTNGIHGDYKDKAFVNSFLHSIDSISPKILVLQEMYIQYSDTLCNELQNRYPYNSLQELAKQKFEDKRVACIFSSYPIKSLYRYKFNKEEIDSIYNLLSVPDSLNRTLNTDIYNVVLEIDGNKSLVVCCYLKTNDYSRFRHEHYDSWFDGIDDYFNGYNLGSTVRTLNAKMIRDSIVKYDLPTIVCGDMNDFQCSQTLQKLMGDDLKNVWWKRGFGYGMTYNKYHLKIRIDHVLISNKIQALRVDVPHLRFSDHYPVVADLRFNGN